jgi:predicted N-acetyltransferase YhbS
VIDAEDVERLAAFNGSIHDEGVADLTRRLMIDHPHTRPEHWLFVEDEAAGQIVSSLCLIPWRWRYQDVELKAGEMGIVGTLPAYRHRGLVRALAARHAELLREGGYDLSHIQGIPYFYRQLGYEYAIPLEGGWRVELHQIPDPTPENPARYQFRPASLDDLPVLMRLYRQAAEELTISAVRDEPTWRYLLGPGLETDTGADTWLVMDPTTQEPAGYFRISHRGFGQGMIVSEVSHLSGDAAMAVLHRLKALALERELPYIRLNLPEHTALVQTARRFSAHDLGRYAWQIRLVDLADLLGQLAPVFERRLAASPFAGLTGALRLNLYREAFELRFEAGRPAGVNPLGFIDGGDVRMPPPLIIPLLLGYRTLEELGRSYHDVSSRGQSGYLAQVLFPRVESFIYTIY